VTGDIVPERRRQALKISVVRRAQAEANASKKVARRKHEKRRRALCAPENACAICAYIKANMYLISDVVIFRAQHRKRRLISERRTASQLWRWHQQTRNKLASRVAPHHVWLNVGIIISSTLMAFSGNEMKNWRNKLRLINESGMKPGEKPAISSWRNRGVSASENENRTWTKICVKTQ
jgi:hypothetical protein